MPRALGTTAVLVVAVAALRPTPAHACSPGRSEVPHPLVESTSATSDVENVLSGPPGGAWWLVNDVARTEAPDVVLTNDAGGTLTVDKLWSGPIVEVLAIPVDAPAPSTWRTPSGAVVDVVDAPREDPAPPVLEFLDAQPAVFSGYEGTCIPFVVFPKEVRFGRVSLHVAFEPTQLEQDAVLDFWLLPRGGEPVDEDDGRFADGWSPTWRWQRFGGEADDDLVLDIGVTMPGEHTLFGRARNVADGVASDVVAIDVEMPAEGGCGAAEGRAGLAPCIALLAMLRAASRRRP